MESLETPGQFWSSEDNSKRIDGALTWEPGSPARLTLKSRVIDEAAAPFTVTPETGGLQITRSGDPARIVADGVPRLILGDTDLGPVTCVDSYLQHPPMNLFDFTTPPLQQVWDPYTLIIGAHLTEGHATQLDAVKLVLDSPVWWSHLPDRASASDDAGEIVCERVGGETWLEFRPSSTMSIRSADRAVRSVVTLAKLALDAELTPTRVQIRNAGQSDWLEVKTDRTDPCTTSAPNPRNLLSPDALTLERVARWLAIEQTMDGLAAAVADPVEKQAIQVHALIACSLVEGIHKRIVGSKRDYVGRAGDLHAMAQRIASDITDPVAEWARLVKTARNDLAHHNTGRTFDAQFLNWMIAESSVIWVLRLCLLGHTGFTDEEVRTALADHQRYAFYRENLRMHVKERDAITSP
ncbi:HEPN domain-containing protein [Rhodococcus maanshanensis]|uniref:ApeA N-terminal domain-containing protein n=1 Tax=Rhodococcus maanshanensis TaxID=183556 RepID=A0A1H7V426_9NOCA|nr:HEPN domain-containing protein [Rhodococcus maanshanensis]SEM03991.1 hypothetical protein SAMN05444583_12083 [Rhodococcus maanshanensis]